MAQAKTRTNPAVGSNGAATTAVVKRRAIDEIVPEIIGGADGFDVEALREAQSFADFAALAAEAHGGLVDAGEVLGDGFTVLEDKSLLEDKQMLVMGWVFRDGDFSSKYVSMRVVAAMPGGGTLKCIVNDGGAGIPNELAAFQLKSGKTGGLLVKGGLRKSEYPTHQDGTPLTKQEIKDGVQAHGKGTTWYLNP